MIGGKMTKKTNRLLFEWVMYIVILLVTLAIGGSFIAGKYTDVIILSMLPLIVHQIAGWIIVITTVIGLVYRIIK
jgi:hypothetical protein